MSESKRPARAASTVATDVREIAKHNPLVDVNQILEIDRVLADLSNRGVRNKQYEVASPYERGRKSRS